MGNVLKSMFGSKGTHVDMNIFEMLFYGLIPMIGQLFMRINKLGGSLDQLYLLFPLFFIPPFSFIPVIVAKMGFIKKIEGETPIDIYIVIPIIFRFILTLMVAHASDIGGILTQSMLVLGALFVANYIHVAGSKECENIPVELGTKVVKAGADSLLQYAGGVLSSGLVLLLPFIGEMLESAKLFQIPYIAQIIDALVWGFGLMTGYLLVNMYDANYKTSTETCEGKTSMLRMIVSVIAFVVALLYQVKDVISIF